MSSKVLAFGPATVIYPLQINVITSEIQESSTVHWFSSGNLDQQFKTVDKRVSEVLYDYQKYKKEQMREPGRPLFLIFPSPGHEFKNDKIIFLF